MSVPITPTVCSTIVEPCPTPTPCAQTGAGIRTETPQILENGLLSDVDLDLINFEDPPSSADLGQDGVIAGTSGTYSLFFTMVFGDTLDAAVVTTFVYVDGIEVRSFPHVLAPVSTTQSAGVSLTLSQGSLVQLFVRQDGGLEGVLLNSASLSIMLPCPGQ